MVPKWATGAIINITGSVAINLGTNLMKLSHKVRICHGMGLEVYWSPWLYKRMNTCCPAVCKTLSMLS